MKNKEKTIKIGDIVIIVCLLLLSAIIFLSSLPSRNKIVADAVISVNGREYARCPLNQDREIEIEQNGHVNIIEIKDGAVRMKGADCPDQTCVNQSWISMGGEVIVCLPSRLTVTLDGGGVQVDSVAY